MRIQLLAVGSKMPAWVETGFDEYRKRLPAECELVLREIPLSKRGKSTDVVRAIEREGEQMLSHVGSDTHVVALEVDGKTWSTEQLAQQLARWQMHARGVALLVGGPEGLAQCARARAVERWSLSPLTLPHPLVRVVIAEQLYRAWSINNNHPYHRAG